VARRGGDVPLKRSPGWVAVLGGAVVAALLVWRTPAVPHEDAAMLMRYAGHLAGGHGFVWNVGEPPVDGATDALPVVAAAALTAAGLAPERAVGLLALAAHLAAVGVLFAGLCRHGTPPWLAAAAALWLAFGPALRYAQVGFVTPVFALAALALWQTAYRFDGNPARATAWALAGWSLVLGLTRPEGVLLAGFVLLALAMSGRLAEKRRALLVPLGAGLALGVAYFLWRWHSFGQLLPTPFYKKGGFAWHASGLRLSIEWAARHLWIVALPLLLALRSPAGRRAVRFVAVPGALFALAWGLLSEEMNYLGRFQYALLPMALWSAAAAWRWWLPERSAGGRRLVPWALGAALVLHGLAWRPQPHLDGRREVALALAPLAPRGLTMAVTEAGLLPFYSGWRAVDTWGLNDPEIARRGLTRRRLEREAPDLIQFHGFTVRPSPASGTAWERMTGTLWEYAVDRGYLAAARWGPSEGETHAYLVRPDSPHAAAIIQAVRPSAYAWFDGGEARNWVESVAPAR
jgi:hypothetical protein